MFLNLEHNIHTISTLFSSEGGYTPFHKKKPTCLSQVIYMMLSKSRTSNWRLASSEVTELKKAEPLELFKLEAIAEAFQDRLLTDNIVHDPILGTRTICRSFLGKDAVSVLVEVLKNSTTGEAEVTRERALVVGRKIAEEFRLFAHHASSGGKDASLVLQDNKEIYFFQNNLPIQVHKMKKQYPSPWDRVKLVEEHIQVKDHKGLLRVYQNCFVASEAVDVLMELKLVRSRGEGVHMMQKMNEKVNFFKPANAMDPSEFKDDKYMYLTFVPKEFRNPEPKTARKTAVSPKKSSSRSWLRQSKSTELESSTSLSPNLPPRTKSLETDGSVRSCRTYSPKDKSYFEDRARCIRGRLDELRREKRSATTSAA